MFLEKIDWNNPRFERWNLMNLAPLNEAQQDAFFEDDDVDFPEFSDEELKEIALKFPCRVELFHSNVCHGVEKSWPKRLFGKMNYQDLRLHEKRKLIELMSRYGVKLYQKFVDEDHLKRRLQRQTNLALAEYYQERQLRNQFIRIRALGNYAGRTNSESDCSAVTVIDKSKSASTGEPTNHQAALNLTSVNVTKRSKNRVKRQRTKPTANFPGMYTRSKRKAVSKPKKVSFKEPSLEEQEVASSSRMRKLRSNYPQTGQNEDNVLFLSHKDFLTGDDGIAMHVEVANRNSPNDDAGQFKIVGHIDITDDHDNDSDDNDGVLVIDESFDGDTHSQSMELSSVDESSIANMFSSQLNACNETIDIRYMHANFNESVELYLSQINMGFE